MPLLVPADDATPADWLVETLTEFATTVTSVVPRGFAAYVRVFHPASLDLEPVRWAEIAAATGRTAHPGMQLPSLTGIDQRGTHRLPGVYDSGPATGTLPGAEAAALVEVLRAHTTTPGRCWFAAWEGWGSLRADAASAPRFELPSRGYALLRGPVEAATDSVDGFGFRGQLANLWWPDDRAWCVASEIDLVTTYVGCSAACRDAIVDRDDLEALEVDPGCGITYASDDLNG